MKQAKLEYERLLSLFKQGAAPATDVDISKARLEKLAAEYQYSKRLQT